MTFDVSAFRSKIGAPLRNNKFIVRMEHVPPGLRGTGFEKLIPDLEFYCETVDVPSVSLMTGEVRSYGYGPVERKPYAPMFDDCRMIVRGDQDGRIFGLLKAWQALAINYELIDTISDQTGRVGTGGVTGTAAVTGTPYEVGYKEDYAVPVSIILLREDGKQSHKVMMMDAYPLSVGPTSLSWEATNEYARLPVTLAYSAVATLGVKFGQT